MPNKKPVKKAVHAVKTLKATGGSWSPFNARLPGHDKRVQKRLQQKKGKA